MIVETLEPGDPRNGKVCMFCGERVVAGDDVTQVADGVAHPLCVAIDELTEGERGRLRGLLEDVSVDLMVPPGTLELRGGDGVVVARTAKIFDVLDDT